MELKLQPLKIVQQPFIEKNKRTGNVKITAFSRETSALSFLKASLSRKTRMSIVKSFFKKFTFSCQILDE